MRPKVAIAFCVHHKPWLMMATLISVLLQDEQEADFYFLFNVGDGSCAGKRSYDEYRQLSTANGVPPSLDVERESYRQYDRLASQYGINPKLSPFDPRVRQVCRLNRSRIFEMEFENDHALDSGAWYKFIRSGRWRSYDYVFCLQEGTLLTRPTVILASLALAAEQGIHVLTAGHMKSRLPKSMVFTYNGREPGATTLDLFHDRMIRAVFDIYSRDPEFKALLGRWSDTIAPSRQHHVPDIWGHRWWRRMRYAADSAAPLPSHALKRPLAALLRRHRSFFSQADAWSACANLMFGRHVAKRLRSAGTNRSEIIYVDGTRRPARDVASVIERQGVRCHQEQSLEWYGCSCNHLFSRTCLEQLSQRMEQYRLYDALELPFAGSALEIIWGLLPQWLGVEKWFSDGLHRVAKHFVTYRREDDPEGLASYLNRYYSGRICVGWDGDYLRIEQATKTDAKRLRAILDLLYFNKAPRETTPANIRAK